MESQVAAGMGSDTDDADDTDESREQSCILASPNPPVHWLRPMLVLSKVECSRLVVGLRKMIFAN